MIPLWRLIRLYARFWPWLAAATAAALAALLANITLMALSGWFIAAMGLAGAAGTSLDYFTPAAAIRACALLRTLGRYADRLLGHEATFRLLARLRRWLFVRLEPQPPTVLEAFHGADVASRLRRDVDRLENAHLRILSPLLTGILGSVGVVVWLHGLAPTPALAEAILLTLTGLVVPALLLGIGLRRGRRQVRLTSALNDAAIDGVQGMGDLLTSRGGQDFMADFSRLNHALEDELAGLGRWNGLAQAAQTLCAHLAPLAVLVLSLPLLRSGALDHPDLVMVMLAALAAFEATAPLPGTVLALGGLLESAERVFALADGPPPIDPIWEDNPVFPNHCDLTLKDLAFAYHPSAPVHHGLTLAIPQGRKIAITGPIGSGKSTLILLLAGLLEPGSGEIRLNGRLAGDYTPDSRRRFFSIALQHPDLFSGSLRQVLRLGAEQTDDDSLWRVLDQVGLAAGLFPQGLDTWLGAGGQTLSGGQARRLSVARALLRPAPVLILDEPGEGLDYATENALLKAVVDHLNGRTLILISHRRAGLEDMDQIVSLN